MTTQTPVQEKKHYRMAAPLGITILCLALVGVIALVSAGIYGIRTLQDDSGRKAAILSDVSLIVSLDPVPFEKVEDAGESFVLTAALWQAINVNNAENGYPSNEDGNLIVPKSDAEVAFKKLFGPGHELPIPSADSEGGIGYDASVNSYLVPISAFVANMRGVIAEDFRIKEKDGVYTVEIGYQSTEMTQAEIQSSDETNGIYKTLIYELGKSESGYYVIAIREPEAQH